MHSIHRIAATATAAAALWLPATATAAGFAPDRVGPAASAFQPSGGDRLAPVHDTPAAPAFQPSGGDRLAPVHDTPAAPAFQPSGSDRLAPGSDGGDPTTRIVEVPTQTGFEWGAAAMGGAATLALVVLLAGGSMTLRPRLQRTAAPSR